MSNNNNKWIQRYKKWNGRLGWALHCGIQFYKLNWKYNILAFLSACVSQNGIMHSKKKKKRKKRS